MCNGPYSNSSAPKHVTLLLLYKLRDAVIK